MHERRFSGPVVADEPDALAAAAGKRDARNSTDGAEILFNAVQPDEIFAAFPHIQPVGP